MTVRAAIEAFLAVGPKRGQDQSGPAPMDVDAMTRKCKGKGGKSKGKGKGGKDKDEGNGIGKDTEREKECDSKVAGDTAVNWGTDSKTVGRNKESKGTAWKLTLQTLRRHVLHPSKHL